MNLKIRKQLSSIRDLKIIGASKLAHLLAKNLIPPPKSEMVMETLHGFKLKIDPVKDNGVERTIYYFGTYEKGTLHIIENLLNPGDCFVDVGANIGLMSMLASQKVGKNGKVISFEPNPGTRKILEENVALNAAENITVEGLALSNDSKAGKIYDHWNMNRGSASMLKPSENAEGYDIMETTASLYFKDFENIDLMKIDVEGYELEVLKGAYSLFKTMETMPILIVEFSSHRVNSFGVDTSPLYSFLNDDLGYRIFKTATKEKTSKLVEVKSPADLPKHDNLYCFTDNHLAKAPKKIFK